MKKILMVAYHFPPSANSSGHLRTLALARYLPRFGWEPTVLTAHRRAYALLDDNLLASVPDSVSVTRAFALDAKKHFAIRGAYPQLLAQPDRWASWWFGAVTAGLRLIRRDRPQLIWSTCPIVSAHLIGYSLHRLTGIPWVADFRDPIATMGVGVGVLTARSRQWVERRTLAYASRSVFTTSGAMADYAGRYPERKASLDVIPNGYDERDFDVLSDVRTTSTAVSRGPITLIHSGVLYREGRNPGAFFSAIAALREKGEVDGGSLQVILRASGHRDEYKSTINELGLSDIVKLRSRIPYREALAEMAGADGLLLFQGSIHNRQIPAKVYEYLRVARPIFALTDISGDTANLLSSLGIDSIAAMDNPSVIAAVLHDFLTRVKNGAIALPTPERVAQYSREAGAQRFAALFDRVVGG